MSPQRAQRKVPAAAELCSAQSACLKFLDQSLNLIPAAPLPMTTSFLLQLHEPN